MGRFPQRIRKSSEGSYTKSFRLTRDNRQRDLRFRYIHNFFPINAILTTYYHLARAQSRSATPEPERARHIASQDAINLPRYRHRSSSLLPGNQRGSDPSDDPLPDAALFTPLGGIAREQTDSLLRPGQRRGSGTGSLLLAAGGLDSSFSAGDGGVDYAPVDLGFDLGIDLPP